MQIAPLATFATPEPSGEQRREYELYPETILLREIGERDTTERTIPLSSFTTEERRQLLHTPFGTRVTVLRTLVFLAGIILLPLGMMKDVNPLFPIFGFVLLQVAGAITVWQLLHLSQMWWLSIEFVHLHDGVPPATLGVMSDGHRYAERDRFIAAFREQIRKCRTVEGREQPISRP